jgi:regulator of sigma E protease
MFTTLFAFVFLLSVLIFVHEFGHFLVAKACGVRVLKFSIGFGPPVGFGRYRLCWRRGHTEYVIAWFPIGGFVKMLGENLDESDDPALLAHPDEALTGKRTWQKLAIVFAGPAMNLVLPVAVFMVTLGIGVPRPTPVIGSVEPGSPAAVAGLRPGDSLIRAGGEPLHWWSDFDDWVRAHPAQTLPIQFERDGEMHDVAVELASRTSFDEFGGLTKAGWIGAQHSRLSAMLGVPSADSAAARAGLRSGDVVESVGGVAVEDWQTLARAYAAAKGEVVLQLRRGGAKTGKTLSLPVPAAGDLAALGVVPASVLVASVEPDTPAARAGLRKGDLILTVDGAPVGSFASFAERIRTSQGRALDLSFARDGQPMRVSIAPELASLDVTGLGVEESRYRVGIGAEVQSLAGALRVDRERNPLVSFPRAVGMTVEITHTFLRGLGKLVTGEVSRKEVAGPIGIAEIAGNAFEAGWETYLSIMVLISINLGILNLLPIPILDGGQAMIFAVEGIRRSPLSLRTREIFQQIGFTVLVLLMGLAFWNDLSRQWVRLLEWLSGGAGH